MLDRASLKQSAKEKLKGRWGMGVLIALIYFLINGAFSALGNIKETGFFFGLASIFISAPLTLGMAVAFLALIKSDSLVFENLFSGFRCYPKSLGMYLWTALWVVLWALLFIVPGIIKAIAYSQVFFIIADNQNVRVRDAMKISMKMTDGRKGDLFVLGLSFLGWALLSILTLCIGFLWLVPYYQTTMANTYLKLKEMSLQSGACTEDMFSGKQALVQ